MRDKALLQSSIARMYRLAGTPTEDQKKTTLASLSHAQSELIIRSLVSHLARHPENNELMEALMDVISAMKLVQTIIERTEELDGEW